MINDTVKVAAGQGETDAPPAVEQGAGAPALPEAAPVEPPRALVPGAFLRLEFEIKQVISRGLTNLYLAHAGDYGQAVARLIAERAELPAPATPAPAAPTPATEPPALIGATDDEEKLEGALEEEALAEGQTPVARAAPDRAADTPAADEAEHTWGNAPPVAEGGSGSPGLQSPLFLPCERFMQDEREYLAFDYCETTALQDYREATNDVRYLEVLGAVAGGLLELEQKHLVATFTRDLLRLDGAGNIRFYGFIDPQPPAADASAGTQPVEEAPPASLEQLRAINSFLLKHVFAESSTIRLGDEFGALCLTEEVKELARRIEEEEFGTIGEATAAIAALHRPDSPLRVHTALLSDVGRERELNEDSGMILRLERAAHLGGYQLDLYVVADGMGGHEGGEVASDLTLTSLQRNLTQRLSVNWRDNVEVRQALLDVIDAVNADVVALTQTPQYRAMRAKPGSTLVFGVRVGPRLFVGNVGDSRAYKYNAASGLQRITKDHSYVQTLVDRGEITDDEAWDHPEGSIITSNIGDPRLRLRDVFLRLMAPGDKLLLVSDGVVDMLRDRDIARFLDEPDAHTVCRGIVDASNAAGGGDNITAICVTFA